MEVLKFPKYLQKYKAQLERVNLQYMLSEIYEDNTKIMGIEILDSSKVQEELKKYVIEIEYEVYSKDMGTYYSTITLGLNKTNSKPIIEFNDSIDHSGFRVDDEAEAYSICEKYLIPDESPEEQYFQSLFIKG